MNRVLINTTRVSCVPLKFVLQNVTLWLFSLMMFRADGVCMSHSVSPYHQHHPHPRPPVGCCGSGLSLRRWGPASSTGNCGSHPSSAYHNLPNTNTHTHTQARSEQSDSGWTLVPSKTSKKTYSVISVKATWKCGMPVQVSSELPLVVQTEQHSSRSS